MRTLITGIVIFCLLCGKALSQWSSDPVEIFEEAYEYYFFGEYSEALPLFLALLRNDPGNSNLNFLTGVCYFNIDGQRQRALPFLEEAAKNVSIDYTEESFDEKRAPVDCLWYLGVAYRLAFRFEESLESFDRLTGILEHIYDMRNIIREKEITKDAEIFFKNERPVGRVIAEGRPEPDAMNRNIVVSGDESTIAYSGSLKFYDAVFVIRKTDDGWSRPSNITMQIGSDGMAYPVFLSWDGSEIYLYQYDRLANANLYVSNLQNNRWSAMRKLNENINSAGYEQNASVTRDGRSIYFSSNRLSGHGGFDIYRSVLDRNNEWGPAENLGYPVNTPFDESYPFISPDGKKLFFSSKGHRGMGGYDIFISHMKVDGTWSEPRNLGYPFNTPDNDAFIMPVGDGTEAYANLRKADNPDLREFIKIGGLDVDPPPMAILIMNIQSEYPDEGDSLPVVMKPVQPPVAEAFPLIVETEPVLFGFDSYDLDRKAREITLGIAQILTEHTGILIEVRGYTDALGPASYNRGLAERRARAVAGALVAGGIDNDRITVIAVGMKDYLARNTTDDGRDNPEGRKFNRRVQFVLSDLPGHIKQAEKMIIPEHLIIEPN